MFKIFNTLCQHGPPHTTRNQASRIVYESGKIRHQPPRPSARPLWSEGTAAHPFFASRRPNRPAGLRFDSFLLPNSDDAARLCQDRARGWRALRSIRCRRPHRQGQPRRFILCAGPQGGTLPPAVVTLLGGRRSPVTGECPPHRALPEALTKGGTWSTVGSLTSRAGELRSAPSGPDDRDRVAGKRYLGALGVQLVASHPGPGS